MFNFQSILTKLINFKAGLSKSVAKDTMSNKSPNPKATKLKIIYKGNVSLFFANQDQVVEGLITEALTHFNVDNASEVAKDFKLIVVSNGKAVGCSNIKIAEIEDLKGNEELLLVQRYIRSEADDKATTESTDRIETPTIQDIITLTADVVPKNTVRQVPLGFSSNFLSEIRKIFITLSEASAMLLSATPEAGAVAADLRQRLDVPLDPGKMARLTAIGYSAQDAATALRLHHMDDSAALDWLLSSRPLQVPTGEASGGSETVAAPAPVPAPTQDEPLRQLVARLLEDFRAAKRRNFKVHPRAAQNLAEMGFDNMETVHQALLVTGNNQNSACEWLLGERRPSLLDLDSALDETGPMYASVMANPVIQLGIRTPRVLLALLSMIENPDCINKWLRDAEAGQVISQVFKTYHAEKHA